MSVSESFFGFGAFLLQQLSKPMTIDDLWEYYKEEYSNKRYSTKFSFDQYIMALDYLFIIGAIEKMKGDCCVMRLISLTANQKSFHPIIFKDGINIIAGKQVTPHNENDGNTYNGVGKSLTLHLIHFVWDQEKLNLLRKLFQSGSLH